MTNEALLNECACFCRTLVMLAYFLGYVTEGDSAARVMKEW